MSRNRKSQSAAIRFGPALKALLLCLLIGGSGVGYVWQKDQIVRLSRQIKSREERLNQLRAYNETLRRQLEDLRTLRNLEKQIARLGLVAPRQAQIVRLPEPAADGSPPPHSPQYVAGNHGSAVLP